MDRDTLRLHRHFGTLTEISDRYAQASQSRCGTPYGVELRTLASARRAMADDYARRLRDRGIEPRLIGPFELVEVEALLSKDPRAGAQEVLQAERLLIDDIIESSNDSAISEETRAVFLSTLKTLHAHRRRVETFLDTL